MKKKKVKSKPKKKSIPKKKVTRQKTYGDAQIVRPVSEYYDAQTGEIYPKIFFRKDTLWDKIKRFFGYIP